MTHAAFPAFAQNSIECHALSRSCAGRDIREASSAAATTPENGGGAECPLVEKVLLQHCHIVVSTMGKQGACAVCSNGDRVQVPACAVPVVDTVGAGDFFCGAFLAAHMHGLPLGSCLSAGCAAGAQVVQSSGAHLSEGSWRELRATFDCLLGGESAR